MSLNPSPTPPARAPALGGPILAVVLLVVAGVSVAATAAYFEVRPPSAGISGSTVSLTDDLGRSVTVPLQPHRVVVLSPNIMDSLYRLGLRDDVVGVDCSAAFGGLSGDYSSEQISQWNLSSSLCVPVEPLSVEKLIAAQPQLVLASTIISLADIEEVQSTYQIPVVVLAPATIGGIVTDVGLLGQIFGGSGTLNALTAQLQAELGNATLLASNASLTRPTVLLTYYPDPAGEPDPGYYTYGPDTFGNSLVELAGGASISANDSIAYPLLSGPAVLLADPSFIIYGTGFGLSLSDYQAGPDWSQFGAVTQGHLDGIDSNLVTEADPTMILQGLPALTADLHPSS
jgi:iron complex transport system substrate-binding protein